MGDSLVGTTKNIVIPLRTVYTNRTTYIRMESAKKSCKKRVFSPSILMVHLIHVGNEVQQLVGIAPLVVIPGDELYKVVVQHDARRLIEDTGLGEAGQVRGNHLVPGAGDDALHAVLGGVLHGVATSGDLAGVAFSHGPEEVVGQSVLAEAAQNLIVNLVRRDVGYIGC